MATILEFRPSGRTPPAALSKAAHAGSAELVLFPGVRYDRWLERPARKARARSRKRDKLELKD